MDIEYRKLKNQARFVLEIIDNKLIVSKKRKPVIVGELRKREYEPFPKVKDAQKSGETDDTVENDEEVSPDEDAGARDYDYLLGVCLLLLGILLFANDRRCQSGLLPKSVSTSSRIR